VNPRLFCRERAYHKALLLTYSFDPVFFEQVVLPDLWAGRSGDILVLGDREQINVSLLAAAGQLWHLGKQYLLAPAHQAGAFHPKVLLRMGARDGAIMIGSGNVTSRGWGANQELGTGWMLGPGHADEGAWLRSFLDDVMNWCGGDLEKEAVLRMKDVPWLSLAAAGTPSPSPVVYSRHGRALATQLSQRWAGRKFEELRILTGSTDESGAFLRWAHTTFGIKRAVIALTPSMASFRLEKLEDLPIELRLVAAPPSRVLHAKCYWFEGAEAPAAVMGSANCSAAAWLLPPDQGGNVETVVVYDAPRPDDFSKLLEIFDQPSFAPADFLPPSSTVAPKQQPPSPDYVLRSLRWDSTLKRVLAVIAPAPASTMAVDLLLHGRYLSMAPIEGDSDDHWACDVPDEIGSATAFGSVRLRLGDRAWWTPSRWIDDLGALQHASQSARLSEPFRGMDGAATPAEQRQVMDDLQEIAQALFNDPASFRDPGFGAGRDGKKDSEGSAAPVDPNDLICHLDEPRDAAQIQSIGSPTAGHFSLTGILRVLFDSEGDVVGAIAAAEDEQLDEEPNENELSASPSTMKPTVGKPKALDPVVARSRNRLATQIKTFLTQLSATEFADRCSATQMVQAVSFPLAVALRGQKRGWVSGDDAEKWGLEVFSILFRGATPGSGGLLGTVAKRYERDGNGAAFSEIVGDGTLWMVLVATLGNSKWDGVGTFIDKAVALREVFTSSQLLSSAHVHRISGLLGKIRVEDARRYLAEVAPAATQGLELIEGILRPLWEQEARSQTARKITHEIGDLLWRDKVGWAICLNKVRSDDGQNIRARLRGREKSIKASYYVNVTELASRTLHLWNHIAELRSRLEPSDRTL
jgi:hypothetical protein